VIVELIRDHRTDGLAGPRGTDRGRYPLGTKVDDAELAAVPLVQADSKLVAAGTADPGTGSGRDFTLARYRPNGSPGRKLRGGRHGDTDFGANGLDRANALAVQADGRLVAAGSPNNSFGFGSDFGLARYLAR
jgi:hypothetical protein